MNKEYDVIIVGGGHAGVEAALVVARMGLKSAIITMEADKLALMSCNPAIGGLGKSHLVKEIDALGGVMAQAADAAGIQFRRLNLSRGPAVWATRIQCDRDKYNQYVVEFVKQQKNVDIIEALAGEVLVEDNRCCGIKTESGEIINSKAVIICTGTFLGGLIHIGEKKIRAGRIGENSAYKLSESFQSLGFELGRLKTGTPPRLDGDTIDWSKCEIQPGDEPIPFFSPYSKRDLFEQTPCHITYTSSRTKQIISENFHTSPIFSGQINSTGPRYCPSIEDKFYRFSDKESHQIFLEPEGNGTSEIYPNGFSTALPEQVQYDAVRTIIGLENVKVTRPGYAVEYDYCPAYQIKPTLETRRLKRLYLAGQINGTSGYEEAAGQGLMAGINASAEILGLKPLIIDRSEAYIGVMIDDLTTRSTTEPYRLFTSRAEYRLALREDNARDRLNQYAKVYNIVDKDRLERFDQLKKDTDITIQLFKKQRLSLDKLEVVGGKFKKQNSISVEHLLKQPSVTIHDCLDLLETENASDNGNGIEHLERAAIQIKYKGYIEKQQREINKFKKLEHESIPEQFEYTSVKGLKTEAKEKLSKFKPISLGAAGRIEGITAGDLAVLSVYLKRFKESRV